MLLLTVSGRQTPFAMCSQRRSSGIRDRYAYARSPRAATSLTGCQVTSLKSNLAVNLCFYTSTCIETLIYLDLISLKKENSTS